MRGYPSLLNETVLSLIKYRLEQARGCLDSAMREFGADAYDSAANRSYYCVFHAMRAVLATDTFDAKKHSGIISAFQQKYIKTGTFSPTFSKLIRNAFINRSKSDYEDFFVMTKEDVSELIDDAKTFLAAIEGYLKEMINSTEASSAETIVAATGLTREEAE